MNSYLSPLHMRLILRAHPKNSGANCCTRLSWPELKPRQVWYYVQWTEFTESKSGGKGHVEKYSTMHCFRLPRTTYTTFIILTEYLWEFQRQIALFFDVHYISLVNEHFVYQLTSMIIISQTTVNIYLQYNTYKFSNLNARIIVNKVNAKLSSIYQQKVVTDIQTDPTICHGAWFNWPITYSNIFFRKYINAKKCIPTWLPL